MSVVAPGEPRDIDQNGAIEVLDAGVKTLDANVSAGQMQDVRHQLPKDLRSVFTLAER